jgi:UDP:flavonoid glycosyltransferase YjiC (YdhE family)
VLNEPADLRHVTQTCDLAVLHGTHGVLSEALLAGKPTLNFPLNLEQFLHCRGVARLRAGLTGNPNDPGKVEGLLRKALASETLRAGARAFAARYRALDPSTQADKLAQRLAELLD